MNKKVAPVVHQVFSLYSEFGSEKYEENITHLSHMVQSAQLAMGDGFDEEVIIAAFLHDVGHLYVKSLSPEEIESMDVINHEVIGADFLREIGFSEKIASLVQGHIQAKRYLSLKQEGYYDQLSDASKETLEKQGGAMTEDEAAKFEENDNFGLSLNLRYWNETANKANMKIPNLAFIKEMIIRHLQDNFQKVS